MYNVATETEFHPNQNCATIHIDKVLPDAGGWLSDKKPTEQFKPLFDDLEQINGVVSLRFGDKYQISITKGTVFPWEAIIESASKIIDSFFDPANINNPYRIE